MVFSICSFLRCSVGSFFARFGVWVLFALALVLAPQLLSSSQALSILSQIGCLIIICLSYNILLGQGGMLSFGHAIYTGLGGFVAIHAMGLASAGAWWLSLPLVALVAGLSGMLCAVLFGYVTTQKSGTPFAMITLGLGELVASIALMFPSFFGGESGITANRVYGQPWLGLSFGPAVEVYYLIAAYCFVSTALMFALTRTPLGRILNAVRDNPERVAFIGYNPRCVRYFVFIIAGFFAGIGGGLMAINFEIVTAADSVSLARSGSYLLFTLLGGAGFFFGPIIGAVLLVLSSVLLSQLTQAWLLYLGLMFLCMVIYAPGGIASLVSANWRVARWGRLRELLPSYAALAGSALLAGLGFAVLVEMIYLRQLNAAMGEQLQFLGLELDTRSLACWLAALALLLVGGGLLAIFRGRFMREWNQVQQAIEQQSAQP